MKRFLSLLVFAGCTATSTPSATETLRAFAAHVRAREDEAAWELLSREAQRGTSREDFVAALALDREEIASRAEELADAPVEVEATVPSADGEALYLVEREEGWRIRSGALGVPNTRSPRGAASAFRRALLSGSTTTILRMLSRARRHELYEELRSLTEALSDPRGIEVIERSPDRVTLRLSGGRTIELVMENGEWTVDSWE